MSQERGQHTNAPHAIRVPASGGPQTQLQAYQEQSKKKKKNLIYRVTVFLKPKKQWLRRRPIQSRSLEKELFTVDVIHHDLRRL